METKKNEIIEIEGIKLTQEAIDELCNLQTGTNREGLKKGYGQDLNFIANVWQDGLDDVMRLLVYFQEQDNENEWETLSALHQIRRVHRLLEILKVPEL